MVGYLVGKSLQAIDLWVSFFHANFNMSSSWLLHFAMISVPCLFSYNEKEIG